MQATDIDEVVCPIEIFNNESRDNMKKEIRAIYNDDTIRVYQAYNKNMLMNG